jgi:hypothetical protein
MKHLGGFFEEPTVPELDVPLAPVRYQVPVPGVIDPVEPGPVDPEGLIDPGDPPAGRPDEIGGSNTGWEVGVLLPQSGPCVPTTFHYTSEGDVTWSGTLFGYRVVLTEPGPIRIVKYYWVTHTQDGQSERCIQLNYEVFISYVDNCGYSGRMWIPHRKLLRIDEGYLIAPVCLPTRPPYPIGGDFGYIPADIPDEPDELIPEEEPVIQLPSTYSSVDYGVWTATATGACLVDLLSRAGPDGASDYLYNVIKSYMDAGTYKSHTLVRAYGPSRRDSGLCIYYITHWALTVYYWD